MIDLEDQLRTELRRAADEAPAGSPAGLDAVRSSVDRRARRARRQRTGLVGAVAVFALAAGAVALRAGEPGDRTTATADATPRDGIPGWRTIAAPTLGPRFEHLSVAMDDEILVFGGYNGIGDDNAAGGAEIYDAIEGRWRQVSDPPAGRWNWGLWTGSHVFAVSVEDGRLASYDPAADRWEVRSRGPFTGEGMTLAAVWTGDQVIVVVQGAQDGEGGIAQGSVASYDPATGSWSESSEAPDSDQIDAFNTAVWTGSEMLIASTPGASGSTYSHISLLRYAPDEGWAELPTPPLDLPDSRSLGYAVWTGTELVVGGGSTFGEEAQSLSRELVAENREITPADLEVLRADPAYDAAAWDPAARSWRELPDAPVPTTRLDGRYSSPFTDHEVVAWEGLPEDTYPRQARRLVLLDPATGTWRVSDPAPGGYRLYAPITWTGHELVIVSGEPADTDREPMGCCIPTNDAIAFTP